MSHPQRRLLKRKRQNSLLIPLGLGYLIYKFTKPKKKERKVRKKTSIKKRSQDVSRWVDFLTDIGYGTLPRFLEDSPGIWEWEILDHVDPATLAEMFQEKGYNYSTEDIEMGDYNPEDMKQMLLDSYGTLYDFLLNHPWVYDRYISGYAEFFPEEAERYDIEKVASKHGRIAAVNGLRRIISRLIDKGWSDEKIEAYLLKTSSKKKAQLKSSEELISEIEEVLYNIVKSDFAPKASEEQIKDALFSIWLSGCLNTLDVIQDQIISDLYDGDGFDELVAMGLVEAFPEED